MLDHPLPDLGNWVAFFSAQELPVLRHTQRQLQIARENIDTVNGKDITRIVLQDPLLAARVLAYIQPLTRRARLRHDVTTIAGAIMMLGINTFFKRFDHLATLEDQLRNEPPQALLGALQAVRRCQQAAHYAYEWAVWRLDVNVEEVALAALLHDLAEILIYAFTPRLALDIRDRQQRDPALRSLTVQREILGGFTAQDIKTALYKAWHLPELLLQLVDDQDSEQPRVSNVRLAVNLARHLAQQGWQNAALPDDLKAIAKLLNLSEEALSLRLGLSAPVEDQTVQSARKTNLQITRTTSASE
ncbi:MAG: HDOD domain-containing protein [Zoogloeaceae bacterium]|jgi:HD-like signal output (HDOD) protein|nr:HDOD domain-containing protein [Zoogloeaceae bacterium]